MLAALICTIYETPTSPFHSYSVSSSNTQAYLLVFIYDLFLFLNINKAELRPCP